MSSQPRLLISRADFTNLVKQSSNLDKVDIYPFIRQVQEVYLPNYLGNTLLNELVAEYNGSTLSPANAALLPYVQDFMVYKAYALAIPSFPFNFQNDGIYKGAKNAQEAATQGEVAQLAKHAESQSDRYKNRLWEFLDQNRSDYPNWDYGRNARGSTMRVGKVGRNIRKPANANEHYNRYWKDRNGCCWD